MRQRLILTVNSLNILVMMKNLIQTITSKKEIQIYYPSGPSLTDTYKIYSKRIMY